MRAVLSIGSNMDDRVELLRTVFDEFAGEIVAASSVYATPPWGVTDQDEFLNAVLIVDVDESPKELLRRGQKLDGDDAAEFESLSSLQPAAMSVTADAAATRPAMRRVLCFIGSPSVRDSRALHGSQDRIQDRKHTGGRDRPEIGDWCSVATSARQGRRSGHRSCPNREFHVEATPL